MEGDAAHLINLGCNCGNALTKSSASGSAHHACCALFFFTAFEIGTIHYSNGKGNEIHSSKIGCWDTLKSGKIQIHSGLCALSPTRLSNIGELSPLSYYATMAIHTVCVGLCLSSEIRMSRFHLRLHHSVYPDACLGLATPPHTSHPDWAISSKAKGLTDSIMRDAMMRREINYHNTYSRWTVDCSRFGYIVDEDYYVINS